MQGFTLVLEGHLFDNKCLNNCLDICEDKQLSFRIVAIEVGNDKGQQTRATIQGISLHEAALDEAEAAIKAECGKYEVQVFTGQGPAYDKPMNNMQHAQ
jgi:hypothetical protein